VKERIETGKPYRAILRVAAEEQAGLIVVGRHAQGVVRDNKIVEYRVNANVTFEIE
jgi:nucleotide-binding universal stress UspA family protein